MSTARAPRGLPDPPLLVITDRLASRRPLPDVVVAVLAAGCRWLSVRERDLAPDRLVDLVASIVALAAPFGATVLVAGRADDAVPAARAAGAAGVHLPRDGDAADVAAVRAALGPACLVGLSAHDRTEADRARAAGVDYVTLSPVFASAGKPGYGPALGAAGLAQTARDVDVRIVALGGVDAPGAVAACRAAGAAGVAVMGAVARAGDPGSVVAALIAGWAAGGPTAAPAPGRGRAPRPPDRPGGS